MSGRVPPKNIEVFGLAPYPLLLLPGWVFMVVVWERPLCKLVWLQMHVESKFRTARGQ